MSKKKLIIILSSILGTIALVAAAFFIYVGIYYHADTEAIEAFKYTDVEEREIDDGVIAYVPKGEFDTGRIYSIRTSYALPCI